MKIGITGAKGFLGKILTGHLAKDHQLISIGRSANNDISIDLAKEIPDLPELDILIHSAGKAHVIPKTEEEVRDFFSVNVQ